MKIYYPFLLLLFVSLNSCDRNEEPEENVPSVLNNCYQEEETADQFAGTDHRFCFEDDGILYLEIHYFTDVLDLDNPCPGGRIEKINGTYEFNDQLEITGEVFEVIVDGEITNCDPNPLQLKYTYTEVSSEKLILNPDKVEYFQIHLIKE